MLNAYAHRCHIRIHTLPTMKVFVHSKRQLECERDFNFSLSLFLRNQEKKGNLFYSSFRSSLLERYCIPSHSTETQLSTIRSDINSFLFWFFF